MNALTRWFACAVAAPAILLGACLMRPQWAGRVGLDVWTLPEVQAQVEEGRSSGARIDEQFQQVRACEEGRDRVDDELLAGRIGLLEAAGRYRALNAAAPRGGGDLLHYYGGHSEEERCCRQVIRRVGARLRRESPEDAGRVTAALEAELAEHLRRDGASQIAP
jgi:hypothetical protein